MKFPNLFSKTKNEPQTEGNYLALTLTPDKALACVWDFDLEDIKVKAVEARPFTSPENLIHEAAVAIDTACQKADTDVDKVVFGLSQSWFEGENVSEKAAKILKNVSEDLELVAQAFVSLASALNHFLKVSEGVTPQAILVGIFQGPASAFCEVHLVKNNKVVATKTSAQLLSIEKIIQLIGQLKEGDDTLPSRIVLYGNPQGEFLEKIQSAKMENLFVHQPKVDYIENEKLATAVAYAQAADILGHDPLPAGDKEASLAESRRASLAESRRASLAQTDESRREEPQTEDQQIADMGQLGFVAGVDILEEIDKEPAEKEQVPPPMPLSRQKGPLRNEDYAVEIDPRQYREEEPRIIAPILPKIGIPKLRLPKLPKLSRKLGIILAAIVAFLLLGLFVAGQTLSAAQVNIKVTAKQKDGTFSAKVVPGASYDRSQSQIPGQVITGTASGTQKGTASGSKKIGMQAKGSVNVLNCDTDAPKTFPAQTELITKDGLKFAIDNNIEVPARVGGACGQAAVNATAEDVGSQYNIDTTTASLDIVGYDSALYDANVNTAFTGGDEKQATVVSQEDLDKMAKSLADSLTQKARDDLKAKSQNANITDGSLVITVIKKEFDKKADEETSIINLNMEIEASAVSFNQSDLQKLISEASQSEANFQSRPQDIEIFDLVAKRTKDTLAISGKYRAKQIPKFEENELAAKIAGKSVKEARAIIKQIPEVSEVEVSFSPAFPFVDSIPKNRQKVKFNIQIS